jgi:hypothetical protein
LHGATAVTVIQVHLLSLEHRFDGARIVYLVVLGACIRHGFTVAAMVQISIYLDSILPYEQACLSRVATGLHAFIAFVFAVVLLFACLPLVTTAFCGLRRLYDGWVDGRKNMSLPYALLPSAATACAPPTRHGL